MRPPPGPDRRSAQARSLSLPSGTRSAADAVGACEVLTSLTRRIQASNDRMRALQPLLPPAMRAHVQGGPIDEAGYSLLADSPAVAAKLRQMVPALQAHLRQQGWPEPPIRVKLLTNR